MLSPTSAICGMGLDKSVALLTDGRFSGATGRGYRAYIPGGRHRRQHCTLRDGDIIEIDIPGGRLNVTLSDEELENRRKSLKIKEPEIKTGYLARYAGLVSSAAQGAVLK